MKVTDKKVIKLVCCLLIAGSLAILGDRMDCGLFPQILCSCAEPSQEERGKGEEERGMREQL